MARNLKKRHQTWYARVTVNPKYRKLIGKHETLRSLQTTDYNLARQRVDGVVAQIRFYHDRLIRVHLGEALAADLAAQIERGQLPDDGSAAVILQTEIEAALKAHGRTDSEIEAMTAEDLAPLRETFKIVSNTDELPLSAAIKLYLDAIESDVIPRTWDQKKRQLELFADWSGQVLVTQVDRRLASRYILEILKPNGFSVNYSKNIVAMLRAFFQWLIDAALYEKTNPFSGHGKSLRGSKKGSTVVKNRAWTSEELGKLFQAFDELPRDGVKYKAGIAARIALYSGMRQAEVCGLKVDDVNLDDGFMAITDAKNESSIRQVPIHPEIATLLAELCDSSEDGYVIPGLPSGTRDGKRNHSLGNRFGDVKRNLFPNAGKNELTFHGLRSTFITAMEKAGIPESTAKLIDGHARQNLSYGLYSKGPGLEALRDAISRVAISLN